MSELMWDGVNLMVMGMGTVFVFLAFLVLGTTLMSSIVARLPAPDEIEYKPARSVGVSDNELTEIAAVAAAVRMVHSR